MTGIVIRWQRSEAITTNNVVVEIDIAEKIMKPLFLFGHGCPST
jgi:hypothetical protein